MTLTEASSYTKKAFVFGLIFVFILFVLYFVIQAILKNTKKVVVTPSEQPNLLWQKLPKVVLPESLSDSSGYNYDVNTTDGSLGKDFPKIIKVYFIPKLGITLLARNKASELASKFDFKLGPDIVDSHTYKFKDETGGEMVVDMDTGNFKFKRGKETDPNPDDYEQVIADKNLIVEDFKGFLERRDLVKDQLEEGRIEVEYDKSSQKDSETANASMWQKKVDDLPVVTEKFSQGLVRSTITKAKDEKLRFSTLNYTYWDIEKNNFGTYPLKDVDTAFDELKQGKGIVVIEPESPQISLVKVYLAYYLPEKYTPYLQPVYVFEGDKGSFTALVPAIPDENLEN